MTYCGETTLVKWTRTERQAVSLRCRAWTCEHCADMRKRQLIAQAHRGQANTFITLTCRSGEYDTPDQAAKALAWAWRTIHKRIIREANRDLEKNPVPSSGRMHHVWKTGADGRVPRMVHLQRGRLEYLCVVEAHKSGWPHLHILSRARWIDWNWLRLQMWELLGSPVVDIRRIQKRSAKAAYVAKYCGKCAHRFGNTKRYWQSQGYELTKYEKRNANDNHWWGMEVRTESLINITGLWRMQGWIIEQESPWAIRAQLPP